MRKVGRGKQKEAKGGRDKAIKRAHTIAATCVNSNLPDPNPAFHELPGYVGNHQKTVSWLLWKDESKLFHVTVYFLRGK